MFSNATNAHADCKYNTLSFNMYGNVEKKETSNVLGNHILIN